MVDLLLSRPFTTLIRYLKNLQAKPAKTKSSLAPRIPDMTLKSKYFQSDSLINLHSLATKSARAMKKTDLHGMSGNFHLKSGATN